MRSFIRLSLLLSALLLCCACGKRPDVLDPPDGGDPNAYPHTYPDKSTDPSGVTVPKAEAPKNIYPPKTNTYPDASTDPEGVPVPKVEDIKNRTIE